MSHPLVFFHHFRLGDALQYPSDIIVAGHVPALRERLGAALKGGKFIGGNAHSEYPVTAKMWRNGQGTESRLRFRARIRAHSDALRALWHLGEGPLSVVCDPDGNAHGNGRDASTVAAFTPGSPATFTTTDTTSWAVGQWVLIVDGETFDVAEITNVAVIASITTYSIATTNTYPIGAEVYRLEYHIPEAHLGSEVRFPVPSVGAANEHVANISFLFRTITDVVDGGIG